LELGDSNALLFYGKHWSQDKRIAYRTINARRETVDPAPSFRQTFKRRRCLIPADGFYEWRQIGGPGGTKVPFAIGMKMTPRSCLLVFGRDGKICPSAQWFHTCTIITGDPNELVAQLHTRMSVILPVEHHAAWLGEVEDGDLKALLNPFPAEDMKMWPISPKNNDASLLDPIVVVAAGSGLRRCHRSGYGV
jgi:putative SOS response-associated peptidase YedK